MAHTEKRHQTGKRDAIEAARTFHVENRRLVELVNTRIRPDVARVYAMPRTATNARLAHDLDKDTDSLARMAAHYRRKEELLLPLLQAHGVADAATVMWDEDDTVRNCLTVAKSLTASIAAHPTGSNLSSVADQLDDACEIALTIVAGEEAELLPLALRTLAPEEWDQLARDSRAREYVTCGERPVVWVSPIERAEAAVERAVEAGKLPGARLSKRQAMERNERTYGAEARARYGEKVVAAANAKMAGMDEARWAEAQELADEIIEQLKAAMATGDPAGATAQGLCRTHEAWLRMYWPEGTYSRAAHLGLAHGYLADERFTDYYDSRAGKGATSFLVAALERYCS